MNPYIVRVVNGCWVRSINPRVQIHIPKIRKTDYA